MSAQGRRPTAAETNNIRTRWRNSEIPIGSWVVMPAMGSPEGLAAGGFDCVILEQQHAFISQENLPPLLRAAELAGCTPIVRVGENDIIGIGRALDLGARGIVVPMVSRVAQAQAAADAVRYPPFGKRSVVGQRHYPTTGEANEDIVCLVMIETPEGVDNADAILAVPGIDGAFMGPADLALTMGFEPVADAEAKHPDVLTATEKVAEACKRQGKRFGLMAAREDEVEWAVKLGASFIFYAGDLMYIIAGAQRDVQALRRICDNKD